MIYDSSRPLDCQRLRERLEWLISKSKLVELSEKRKLRTVSQNNYLHLIISWYAVEYGETAKWVKEELLKKQLNPDIFKTEFVNEKTGEIRDEWRSTRDLDTKEMTVAIDRFRHYSSKEAGIYLPEPNDMALINDLKIELSKTSKEFI